MNFGTKVAIQFFALYFTILNNFVSSVDTNSKCPEFNPQNELDIDLINGLWFGAELITHYEGRGTQNEVFDSCVVLQIEEVFAWDDYNYDYDDRFHRTRYSSNTYENDHHMKFVKLTWSELDKAAVYILKFTNFKRGLWIGAEPPKSSRMKNYPAHSHFTGTVQVMKAVGNHLVLTFCEKAELFTIILTRTKAGFAADDGDSVHALLNRRGLAVTSVRELCRYNYAGRATLSTTIVFIAMAISMLRLVEF